jgi:septal ring-binding cell division protein DamX/type II secretory pathway predicted ATPase ExeA
MKDGPLQTDLGTATRVRALFKPGSWLAKIDFINHLVLFNNVLITVLAEKSGGKTSFSALLLDNLDPQIKPVFMATQAPCERKDILADIAAQLHLNMDLETNIRSIIMQINERKAHVLLIIDDAQHWSEELIKEFMIAIKNQDDFGFFHLCLVSDYSIVATLNNLAADQFNNLIHTIELGGLNESEARTYVLQRAMAARLINKPLPDNQLKQFYQLTKGNISRINSSLDSFIFKCSTQKDINKLAIAKKISIAASVAAIVGSSFFYFKNVYDSHSAVTVEPNLISSLPSLNQATNQTIALKQEEAVPSYIPALLDSSTVQLVVNALPKKQILDTAEDDQVVNAVALVDKVIVIPSIKQSNEPMKAAYLAATKVINERLQKEPIKLSRTHSEPPIQQEKTITQVSRVAGYTIQLVASHKKSDVYRFQKSSPLYASTKIRHFANAKGDWYILTIGEFSTRDQAQKKASSLPAPLAKLNPWVRAVSGLTQAG